MTKRIVPTAHPTMLMEIPIAFPLHDVQQQHHQHDHHSRRSSIRHSDSARVPVYVINDVSQTIRYQQEFDHDDESSLSRTNIIGDDNNNINTPLRTTTKPSSLSLQAHDMNSSMSANHRLNDHHSMDNSTSENFDRALTSVTLIKPILPVDKSVSSSSYGKADGDSKTNTYLVTTSPVLGMVSSPSSTLGKPNEASSKKIGLNRYSKKQHAVAVTLFNVMKQDEPISIVYLDLASETHSYQTTVKVQAFATTVRCRQAGHTKSILMNAIQLTFIDSNGFIITIYLSLNDLNPIHNNIVEGSGNTNDFLQHPITTKIDHCYSIGSILDRTIQNAITTYYIRSSMILFLSNKSILISLSPFLIAVDIHNQIAIQWSKSLCMEDMRKRPLGVVGSILSLFTGSGGGSSGTATIDVSNNTTSNYSTKKNKKTILFDMTPISAIVAAENDPTQIFTFHSDKSILRWVANKQPDLQQSYPIDEDDDDDGRLGIRNGDYLKPKEVYDLNIHPKNNAYHIPSPELWSDDINSLLMTARLYDDNRLFVLAIYIQTSSERGSSTALALTATTPMTNHQPHFLHHDHQSVTTSSYTYNDATEYEDFGVDTNAAIYEKQTDTCHIVVLDGIIANTNDNYDSGIHNDDGGNNMEQVHCIKLQVPANTSSLINMSFDAQQDRCVIKALFQKQHSLVSLSSVSSGFHESILVTYPPSNISIVYREPEIISSFSLSKLAIEELHRINLLTFYRHIMYTNVDEGDDKINTNNHINEILHDIDCRFLQYLFRPIFPRGNGLILPPSSYHIKEALQKMLVRSVKHSTGVRFFAPPVLKTGSSIGLQVLRTIHEIRKGDIRRKNESENLQPKHHLYNTNKGNDTINGTNNAGNVVRFAITPIAKRNQTVVATTPITNRMLGNHTPMVRGTPYANISIYEELDEDDDDDDNNLIVPYNTNISSDVDNSTEDHGMASPMNLDTNDQSIANVDDNTAMIGDDRALIQECKLHEQRWRQLLLDIWLEEERERTPLTMYIPPKMTLEDSMLVVRPGCISVTTSGCGLNSSNNATDEDFQGIPKKQELSALDSLSMKLLNIIECREQDKSMMRMAEHFVFEVISKGQLSYNDYILTFMEDKLRSATFDAMIVLLEKDDCKFDIEELESLSENDLFKQLLYEPINSSIPGMGVLSHIVSQSESDGNYEKSLLDVQTRLSGAGLISRTLHTLCRLFLSRYLILIELVQTREVVKTAFRMYLHSTNVLWTSGQIVKLPKTVNLSKFSLMSSETSNSTSPPYKRASHGCELQSILYGQVDKTTALDARLIHLAKRVGMSQFSHSLTTAATSFARAGIHASLLFQDTSSDQAISYEKLPELGMLSVSNDLSNDSAKLIIRLVAPFVLLSDSNEAAHVTAVREELMAKALLIVAQDEGSSKLSKHMIQRAYQLLDFDEFDLPNAIPRIQILNQLSAKNPKVAPFFLNFVNIAIKKLDSLPLGLSPQRAEAFEYCSILWTILFNTAITIQNWETAYEACINNPKEAERINNTRRFVIAMVDSGALSQLLIKCSETNSKRISDSIITPFQKFGDLHGIAVEELTEMSKRDWYVQLTNELEPPSDYNGALYSLFASKNHWKFAAQACDIRYMNAIHCLSKSTDRLGMSVDELGSRDRLIVKDAVAAAVSCYEAMLRVSHSSDQFLVYGESQQLPTIPIKIVNRMQSKRGRGNDFRNSNTRPPADTKKSRLDRFMTLDDLEARAIRSKVLKVLLFDPMCDLSFVKAAFVSNETKVISDREIVGKLFELGYYHEGLMLAKVVVKQLGWKPGGFDIFYEELCHSLTEYLIPVATKINYTPPRPTISQLQDALDFLSGAPSLIIGDTSKRVASRQKYDIQAIAMNLVHKLVVAYVDRDTPIARDVAECILLNAHVVSSVPAWLENILLKGTVGPENSSGLFAVRRQKNVQGYLGDPSILLNLYIRYGLYTDACRVVCYVLNGRDEAFAISRLPEKGYIDFVPYSKIDQLWNVIEEKLTLVHNFNREQKVELQSSRSEMESALAKHFQLLKLSEEGMISARAMSQ